MQTFFFVILIDFFVDEAFNYQKDLKLWRQMATKYFYFKSQYLSVIGLSKCPKRTQIIPLCNIQTDILKSFIARRYKWKWKVQTREWRLRDFSIETCANKIFWFFLQVKKKQEQLLKVRNFLPPQSQEPEIFLLEKLVNQAAEADQKLESVAKAQGQASEGKN